MKKVIVERFTNPDAKGNYYMIVSHELEIAPGVSVDQSSVVKISNKANPHDESFPIKIGDEISLPKKMVS